MMSLQRPYFFSNETVLPMIKIPSLALNDGNSIPQLGFGVYGVSPEATPDVVQGALAAGYRLLDGAYIYQNEEGLGEGVRRSGLPREEIFITTKVWNHEHSQARKAVERSLKSIGVDQLDLVLIHWPVPSQNLYVEAWRALIDMRKDGLVRSIGVSTFNADHLERIVSETGESTAINQIELNPKLQQPELRAANARLGILSEAWTPLGKGASFEAEPIKTAAARAGKTPAQMIIRWHLQLGNVVIPSSSNPGRQAQNLDVFDFELSDAEMAAISTLDVGLRTGPDPSVFKIGAPDW